MSQAIGKIKTGTKQLISGDVGTYKRIFIDLLMGFFIGVLVDIIIEGIMWAIKPDWTKLGVASRLEVGFPFYYKHPTVTGISYDDVILIISSVALLFTRRFWLVIGYTLGWYVSSNEMLYQNIVKAAWPGAP